MGFVYEERASESPYLDTIMRGHTEGHGTTIRPATPHWHMVFARVNGDVYPLVVGPLETSGVLPYTEGAEILWVRFKLGTWLPHLRVRDFVNTETPLPTASSRSFWLKGSAWPFPDYDNIETFVERLVHDEVLVRDPVVNAALHDHLPEIPPRTVRHRFLHTTGLSQNRIYQIERAQQAAALLGRGVSILDTAHELGYFDQPHLTRALKRFVGYTPAQLVPVCNPA